MTFIDKLLNAITMYKVVLYGLSLLTVAAFGLSLIGILPYAFGALLVNFVLISAVCFIINQLFSFLLKVPTNLESSAITALILFFILAPANTGLDLGAVMLTSILAISSKYILNREGKHIFNPVAIALVIMSFAGSGLAIWWVANPYLSVLTLVIGLLIVRKIRRAELFLAFMLSSISIFIIHLFLKGMLNLEEITNFITSWPLLFLGTVMLTEPLTTPPHERFANCLWHCSRHTFFFSISVR